MNLSIKYKVLIAFFFLSIAPLLLLSYFSIITLKSSGQNLINEAVGSLEKEEEKRLIKEAENYAKKVSDFLIDREQELQSLAVTEPDEKKLLEFWSGANGKVWYADYNKGRITEKRTTPPLYKEISFIGADGREKILIKNGLSVKNQDLRYLTEKKNSSYSMEDNFKRTAHLPRGETYVSGLTGTAMTRYDQVGRLSLDRIKGGTRYDGVIRFSAPVYKDGLFLGIITLAMDQIHLQELSIHIEPLYGDHVVFSSYESGNYAFIFEASGWIITHPKYWNFPGVYKDGRSKKYMTSESKKEDIDAGLVGFNLAHAGFVSEGYPRAFNDVMGGKSGIVTVTNVGGVRKVMAYAPIILQHGKSRKLFGGYTIGARLETFESSAKQSHAILLGTLKKYQADILAMFIIIISSIAVAATIFSKHITDPIMTLSQKARFFGDTDFDTWKKIERKDEIGDLAKAFYAMNKKILEQKEELLQSMGELTKAKTQLEDYNFYLKRQIDSLKDEDTRQEDRLSAIGRLAAGLAHEIRNPLTGITLFLDHLHDNLGDNPESQKLIVTTLSELERLEQLVTGLLDFSSVRPPSKIWFDVEDLIDSVEILVKKQCGQRGIQFTRVKPSQIQNIFADKEKLRQAVLNIVLNAVDVMKDGGKIIVASRQVKTESGVYVIIEIKDTGTGIKEEDIEKIFDPFFTQKDGGTGLGLAISKSIINEHGGTIFAKNYESGAVFEIWLPYKAENRE